MTRDLLLPLPLTGLTATDPQLAKPGDMYRNMAQFTLQIAQQRVFIPGRSRNPNAEYGSLEM